MLSSSLLICERKKKNAEARDPPLGADGHARPAQRRVHLDRDGGPGDQARDAVRGEFGKLEREEAGWPFLSIDQVLGGGRFFCFFLSLSLNPLQTRQTKTNEPTTTIHSQDPSVHPRWTGDASAVASEDGRLAKFARKFEGGVVSSGGGAKKKEEKK